MLDEEIVESYPPCNCATGLTVEEIPSEFDFDEPLETNVEILERNSVVNQILVGVEVSIRLFGTHYHADPSCQILIRSEWQSTYSSKLLSGDLGRTFAPCFRSIKWATPEQEQFDAIPITESTFSESFNWSLPETHAGTIGVLAKPHVMVRASGSGYHADPLCGRLVRSQLEEPYHLAPLDAAIELNYVPCKCSIAHDAAIVIWMIGSLRLNR